VPGQEVFRNVIHWLVASFVKHEGMLQAAHTGQQTSFSWVGLSRTKLEGGKQLFAQQAEMNTVVVELWGRATAF